MHILTVGVVTPGFEKAHFERETDGDFLPEVNIDKE